MPYQMMLHTEEDFRAAQLQVCPKAPEYFNATIFNWPIKARLDELKVPDEEL